MSAKQKRYELSLLFIQEAQGIAQKAPDTRTPVIIEVEKTDKETIDSLARVGVQKRFVLTTIPAVVGTIELKPENILLIKEMLEKKQIISIRPLNLLENVCLASPEQS